MTSEERKVRKRDRNRAYDADRSRRRHTMRSTTLNVSRMRKADLDVGRVMYPDDGTRLPRTRGDCVGAERPCAFVSCKFHLYLDVKRSGGITTNFPDLEPDEIPETCALDVADRGGATLDRVADVMNLTRERVRQIEEIAKRKIRLPMLAITE